MKRPARSDSSFGPFMSICPTTEEQSPGGSSNVYSREFQSMLDGLDEEGCVEESGHIAEKKRRLSVDQVKALEKNFEIENKLEPERKVKLAQELGLQPRQVAVWFQNRRARYKTKQLERDYGILKANFDSLKLSYESLQFQNDSLLKEVRDLELKLKEENGTEADVSNKEEMEMVVAESKHKIHLGETEFKEGPVLPSKEKEGSSDSDSSAILNEERSPIAAAGSSSLHQNSHVFPGFSVGSHSDHDQNTDYQPQQFVKTEEHNFFGAEEPCNFFAEDQAPSLQWCWN